MGTRRKADHDIKNMLILHKPLNQYDQLTGRVCNSSNFNVLQDLGVRQVILIIP